MVAVYGTAGQHSVLPRVRASSTRKIVAAAVMALAVCCVALFAVSPTHVVLRQESLASSYKSSAEARDDLSSYFDTEQAKFNVHHSMSSKEALRSADSIFSDKTSGNARLNRKEHREVTQDLAFSSSQAQADFDSYFDNLGGSDSIPSAHSGHGSSSKYIEAKRKALADGDDFSEVNSDGSRTSIRKKWSSQNAAQDMDRIFDMPAAPSHSARKTQTTAAEQQKMIQDYRETHPEFGKKLEEVHAAWMKDHDSLPSTTSERKEYKALMDKIVGNMGDIMKQAKAETGPSPEMKKEALQKYIKEHPEVGRNIVKAKERFMKKYGHAPKSKLEKQDYAHMMKHFVGHVDISVDKELGKKAKAEKLPKEDAAQKQKEEVGDIFKLIDKTVKAFEGKDKKEGEEDANEAEKAIKKALEEKGLQVEVGDDKKMHIHSSVQSASPDDKQKVVSSYTAKHPGVQKKLQEVHKLWRATHSAPPKTPAEEKEYDALLARVVGKLPKVSEIEIMKKSHR